ncbi:Hypothetical predicted protein [Pelobates cultripes]|uniref:Uncharacterized protein n=1 Tax=Pelobates cultripes TaxID=61616 RepID=A0AAD1WME5_PELCU|nr:Hypothetical predicted protein [Pelobates cultripes]
MAPSKQTKIIDPVRQTGKSHVRQIQDGGGSEPHSPGSEGFTDLEDCSLSQADAPVTNKSLHTMMQDLKGSLRADLRQIAAKLRNDMQELGGRTNQLEAKTDKLCIAHNDIVDKLQKVEEEQSTMRLKITDMENRERRNNLHFRGIGDTITQEALPQYLRAKCKALVPHLEDEAWMLKRVHRLPRPTRFTADTPKDTIARFHYYGSKEELLKATRTTAMLQEPYQTISIDADLSAATMAHRRKFVDVTKTYPTDRTTRQNCLSGTGENRWQSWSLRWDWLNLGPTPCNGTILSATASPEKAETRMDTSRLPNETERQSR